MAEEISQEYRKPHAPLPEQPGGMPRFHSLFLGRQGLRAGWGCLLFLVLLFLLGWLGGSVAKQLHAPHLGPGSSMPPAFMVAVELVSLAAVVLVTFCMARLEHRRLLGFGLGDRAFLSRLGGGLVSGFAAISALVGFLWTRHLLVLQGPVLHGATAWRYGLAWAFGFLLVGLFEEMLLRGYLLFTLARGLNFFWAAILLSVAFGAIHGNNKGETPVGLFSAGAVGLVFSLSVWYTRSLWWAIGFHAAWDWGQSFFWGTSDSGMVVKGRLLSERPMGATLMSGGATGPEGSLYIFPLLLLCALFVFLWWRGKGEPRLGFSEVRAFTTE